MFTSKNFTQILQSEVNHLAASSTITDFNTGSVARTLAESHALVIDEVYYQLVNILNGFYLNTATGTDLDRRASDYGLTRMLSTQADVLVTFTGSGSPNIPAGTLVAVPASGSNPQIVFVTTSAGTIGTPITAVAQLAGSSGNVGSSTITTILTNPNAALITGVSNSAQATGGTDQEEDSTFRARIQAYLQSLSHGTINSIISACLNVSGVNTAFVLEGYSLSGYSTSPVTDLANGATLNSPSSSTVGNIVIVIDNGSGSLPASTTATVQNIILGSTSDPIDYPGYKPAGVQAFTTRPSTQSVSAAMTIYITPTADSATVTAALTASLANYIQTVPIGSTLYLADVIEQTMLVPGVLNVSVPSVLLDGSNADLPANTMATKMITSGSWLTITVA